jgi:hypothetical protein
MADLDCCFYQSDLPNEVINIITNFSLKIEETNKFEASYKKYLTDNFADFVIKEISIDIKDYVKNIYPTFHDFLVESFEYGFYDDGVHNRNDNIVVYICKAYIKNIPDICFIKFDLSKDDIYNLLYKYINSTEIECPYNKDIKSIDLIYNIIGKQYSLSTTQIITECENYTHNLYQ